MAKVVLLLLAAVVAVMAWVGDGKPLKKNDPGLNLTLTQEEVDQIFEERSIWIRRQIRRLSKRTGVPCRIVTHHDPDRIPEDIPFAKHKRRRKTCNKKGMVPDYIDVPLLVSRKDGERQYPQLEKVRVACVCLRPRVALTDGPGHTHP